MSHRPRRDLFKGDNAGSQFKSTVQLRAEYIDHPEWPIVNKFPSDLVIYMPGADEVGKFCREYCVLPGGLTFGNWISPSPGGSPKPSYLMELPLWYETRKIS